MSKAPEAPDPYATAQAQAQFNQQTAEYQQSLNMVNQQGPWGSTNYAQTGTSANGAPQYTQTTTYNPAQQQIFDTTTKAQQNLANIASQQSSNVQTALSDPFSFSNDDAQNWAYDLGSQRILPQQKQDQSALRNQLINSGLSPGTDAYNRAMTRLGQTQGDQLNQLALQGRGQAFNEAVATRNQPLNELTALLSGSQVAAPNTGTSATPQTSVGGVDYSGLVSNNYQAQLANSQSALGGLFGLAGSLGGAAIKAGAFSDVRVKENISRVGTLDNGLPVYAYNYVWGGPTHIGVMAQDVERVNPEAVGSVHGIKTVDYGKAVQ